MTYKGWYAIKPKPPTHQSVNSLITSDLLIISIELFLISNSLK